LFILIFILYLLGLNTELLTYQIALTLIPGVGPVNSKNLLSYCGSVEAVFSSPKAKLLKVPGIGKKTIESIQQSKALFEAAQNEIDFIRQNNIQPIFYTDVKYPQRLKQCADGPLLIYKKGEADLNAERMIAIVGTRRISSYGKLICKQLVKQLKQYNVTIVSGLAYGVDFQAHKNACENNITNMAVLGHGLDRIYPAANKPLAQKIQQNGCLLSEFVSGTNPDRENFPKRNRIVAGMCDATIVVETAQKGGAVITAYLAQSYNRDVFAIPGKVGDPVSEGCNNLIKKNIAGLIESAEDLSYQLGWEAKGNTKNKNRQKVLLLDLTAKEQQLYDLLKDNSPGLTVDQISVNKNMPLSEVASTLLSLELQNVVEVLPGNLYKLL